MGEAILAFANSAGGRIDLLSFDTLNGIHVQEWRPKRPEVNATFRQSPYVNGRTPVTYKLNHTTETYEFSAKADLADDLIEMVQDLHRFLIMGLEFHTSTWVSTVCWIECKAANETKKRHAKISFFQPSDDANPFTSPATEIKRGPISKNMAVMVERGDWMANPPGQYECATVSNLRHFESSSLYANKVNMATQIYSLLGTTAGSIIAGGVGEIYRSVNKGTSWSTVATVAALNNVYATIQLLNGWILAAGDGNHLRRSTDDGATWPNTATPGGNVFSFAQVANGTVYAGGSSTLFSSSDNGVTWATVTGSSVLNGEVRGMATVGNVLYMADSVSVWRMEVVIATPVWTRLFFYPITAAFWRMSVDGLGRIILMITTLTGDPVMYRMSGSEKFFQLSVIYESLKTTPVTSKTSFSNISFGPKYALMEFSNSAGPNQSTYRSQDNGETWIRIDRGVNAVETRAVLSMGTMLYQADGTQMKQSDITTIDIGVEGDCSGFAFFSNRDHPGGIGHVKVFDSSAGTYVTINMLAAPATFSIFPAAMDVGDILYVGLARGNNLTLASMSAVIFKILTPIITNQTYTLVWEYVSNVGPVWSSFNVMDNTKNFTEVGVNLVGFSVPTGILLATIDGVNTWWVRCRISAISGAITAPVQDAVHVYGGNNNGVLVTGVGGDIPALAKIRFTLHSDKDGGTTAPDHAINRVVYGTRSLWRGVDFSAYLPFGDTGTGVRREFFTQTQQNGSSSSPSGNYANLLGGLDPDGTIFVKRVTLTLSPNLIKQYYGRYKAFLRWTAASSAVQVYLEITSFSGGVSWRSPVVTCNTSTDGIMEVTDLGTVTLPGGNASVLSSEYGDQNQIVLYAKSSLQNANWYDIVLIPTDESAADITDRVLTPESAISNLRGVRKMLESDSVGNVKLAGRALARMEDINESIYSIWEFSPNGPVVLQANTDQKIWFMSMYYENNVWRTVASITAGIQVSKNERYLSARGSR